MDPKISRVEQIIEDLKLRRPELVEAFIEGLQREDDTGFAGGSLGIELHGPKITLGSAERKIWSESLTKLQDIGERELGDLLIPGGCEPALLHRQLPGGRTASILVTDCLDARAMSLVPHFVRSFDGVEARRAFLWSEGAESLSNSPFPMSTILRILARAGVSQHDPFHNISSPTVLQSVLASPKLAATGADPQVFLGYVVTHQALTSNRSVPFNAPDVIEKLRTSWSGITTTHEMYRCVALLGNREIAEDAARCMARIKQLLGAGQGKALVNRATINEMINALAGPEGSFDRAIVIGCAIACFVRELPKSALQPDFAYWATKAYLRWGDVVTFDDLHHGLVRVTEPNNNFTPKTADELATLLWEVENEISERHMLRLRAEQPECNHLGIVCSPRHQHSVERVLR